MDRPLDDSTIRGRQARRVALVAAAVLGLALALMGASSFLRPSLNYRRLRTAKVDAGPLDASVTAAGTVVPEIEKVLSSPVDARVVKILKRPGAVLAQGEPILQLDLNQSALGLKKLERDLALKENQAARSRLDLESTLSGLDGQIRIKRLQLATLQASSQRNRKLFAEGLVSEEQLRQSELDEARAGVELEQLTVSRGVAQRSADVQLRGLALEEDTLRNERDEERRQLELATTKADGDGVLTFVVSEEGAAVHKGDVLARVADLTSFRVDATVPDVHSSRIRTGQPAVVKVDETRLTGTVSRVLPAIQNGLVTVAIALDDPSNSRLRSNLRVDVELVTDRRAHALRLKKGSFGGSVGGTDVFVIEGTRAVRRRVKLGVFSADAYEVLDGLSEGDEVILSDMSDYAHLSEIRIKEKEE